MGYEEYTWQKYYEDLYHRQKKINNALAVELGETESKAAELEFVLNRVINSPFWRALSPARKIYNKLSHNGGDSEPAFSETKVVSDSASETEIIYKKRLEQYEDYYAQWIRKNEIEQKYTRFGVNVCDYLKTQAQSSHFVYHIFEDQQSNGDVKSSLDDVNSAKYHVFISNKACLADGFEERVNLALAQCEDALLIYTDEDNYYYLNDEPKRFGPNMKPDWSPDTLDSFFYFGNLVIIREDLLNKLDFLGDENPWKNVYDLCLQAADYVGKHFDDSKVLHIPQVLVHIEADISLAPMYNLNFGEKIIGDSEEYNDIKHNAIRRRYDNGLLPKDIDVERCTLVSGQDPDQYHILYKKKEKIRISVLILSKDHPELVKVCLSSFIERTDLSDLDVEFIVVDNGSAEENKALYESTMDELLVNYKHKYIWQPMEFNFSKMCNIAANEADGDFLLFMNDDMEIIQKDWLGLMAGYAVLPHVGAVGAKLLYAGTDKIQHIGVTSLEIGPSHKLVIYPDDKSYYYGKNMLSHDMLCVTAACVLIDKIKFKQIGGFNEDFAVAYNDVDLCMKLVEAGYTCVQCNGALLYHYESMSRGLDADNEDKWKRLLHEKNRLYTLHQAFYKHDPYYNDNLIGNHSNYWSNFDFGYNNHLKCESVRQFDASKLAEIPAGNNKISIDFAGTQAKHNLEEPDITEFRGWCFESGSDNYDHAVNLILKKTLTSDEKQQNDGKNDEENCIFIVPTNVMPRDDVEEIFRNECHVRLSGFVAKILKDDLKQGTYSIGIEVIRLKHDLIAPEINLNELHQVIFTDSFITI